MAKYQFGFIGTGNMGGALAAAVCRRVAPEQVILADFLPAKAEELARRLGCVCAADNAAVARESRFLFLGVKPQMMAGMLAGIAPVLRERTDRFVLVTMAAGLTRRQIREMAGGDYPVIRIMPNTPAAVGQGMILFSPGEEVTGDEVREFCEALSAGGTLDQLPEELIDAGCAISGCGPAFVYQFIEALADGGVACGLPRDKAQRYAAQTLLGAASMVLSTGQHPGQLKDAVCSPGGSTIAGVLAAEEAGLRAAVSGAVLAAYDRTVELGK